MPGSFEKLCSLSKFQNSIGQLTIGKCYYSLNGSAIVSFFY